MNFWKWVWRKRRQLRLQYNAEREAVAIAKRITRRLHYYYRLDTLPPLPRIYLSREPSK